MSAESPPWLKLLQTRAGRTAPAEPATRGELWVALALCLVLAAITVGQPMFDGSRLFFAVDTATAQAPWSKRVQSGPTLPNQDLSDQGVALYPAYRYTAEELSAQRIPKWNSGLSTGVPWLANPQWGVFDPQVLALAALEIVGGRELFDHGLAWLACLRLAAAAFGAYVLARRLGLSRAGAAVSGAGFAGSGVVLAWVNSPVGHVAAMVPWLFVALERLRDRARDDAGWRASARSIALVALATALLVLGGHPETAFFAGLAALAWAGFALEGRARTFGILGIALGTLACAPMLVPFLEYVHHSGALVARRALAAKSGFDFLSIGLVVVTAALVGAWRGLDERSLTGTRWLAGAVGVVFAFVACAFILEGRGAGLAGRVFFLHDALGSPGSGGWRGGGAFVEAAIAWMPAAVVAFALASFLSCRSGTLRARNVVQILALCALLLAIAAPGVADVWRRVPFFGLGATARAAAVSALFLSVLAGEALDAAPRNARRTAGLAFLALVSLTLVMRAPAAPDLVPDPPEPYFAATERPPPVWQKGSAAIAGFIADTLPCDELVLRAERVTADGRVTRDPALSTPLEMKPGVPGRRVFRSKDLELARFTPGTWRFALDVHVRRADGRLERTGSRDVAFSRVAPEPRMSVPSMLFTMLSFLGLLFVAGPHMTASHGRWKWMVVALCVAQPFWFARGLLPSVPREQQFDVTQTERILRERIGVHRVLGGPGVLPGNTALLQRIPSADGYDALDLAAFDSFRLSALKPGAHPVLDWNAAGVDTASTAFRLLGVSHLVFATRADPPEFELVAGPDSDIPKRAETYVYSAKDPLPRAFCAARIVDRDRAIRDPQSFDPRNEAFLEEDETWRPKSPCTQSRVEIVEHADEHVSLRAELDGDALLVMTDAAYPGWVARVDGVETRILTANALFRGVPLTKGAHSIELEYVPRSLHIGMWLGLLAVVMVCILAFMPNRKSPTPKEQIASISLPLPVRLDGG